MNFLFWTETYGERLKQPFVRVSACFDESKLFGNRILYARLRRLENPLSHNAYSYSFSEKEAEILHTC